MSLNHAAIATCFRERFAHQYAVEISGGAAEPLYVPAADGKPAHLYYREDFAASALHEIAHWCIAGTQRRKQVDFGYGYLPPPRDTQAQQKFFQLELKVQTLESLFAEAASIRFQPSADNLEASVAEFALQIGHARAATQRWMTRSPDRRANEFYLALQQCQRVGPLPLSSRHGAARGAR